MLLNTAQLTEVLDSLQGYEIRFCKEFMVDFHPNKALLRAQVYGSQKPSVNKQLAATILNKEPVQTYLAHLKAEMGLNTGVTAERVLTEIAKIAFQDVRELVTMKGGNMAFRDLDDMANTAAIKDIDISAMSGDFATDGKIAKLKTHDKMKALEMLGRHCALFTDNVNLTNNGKDMPASAPMVKVVINHRAAGEPIS